MKSWQVENEQTTPPLATNPAPNLSDNNENTDENLEVEAKLLTGQLLTLVSSMLSYADFLLKASRFSSETPVMKEAMSFALWEMVSRTISMSAQLKTLTSSLKLSPKTTHQGGVMERIADTAQLIATGINEVFDL